MRANPTSHRPQISLSVMLGLAIGGLAPISTVVHAQAPAAVDPPSRVGRLSRLLGTVSFHTADQAAWGAATLNYPITSGNAFWTQPSSAAEADVGSTHLAFDQSTEFNIDVLDDATMQATELQGAVFLRVRNVADGESYRITTPRGVAVITRAGAYEVVAGDADRPTMVTVLEGAARIDTTNASLSLTAGQTGRIEGASNFAASVGPAVRDPFLNAQLLREQQVSRASASSAPPVVAQMTGGYALNNVGSWAPSPQYGRIWYPPVAASWVPYRDGHWGYVAPWGWTWIDDSAWGFAPFHYGRWVRDGARWGWIPAERAEQERFREPPVYAPALVTFLGIGIAVVGSQPNARDFGRGGQGSVGWIPLGPHEAYVPPYQTSDRYARAVNSNNVTTTTNVTNVTTVTNFVNRSAATMVPAAVMTSSQPIAARAVSVNARVLAGARAERAAPVQPTAATVGVTPVVAKQLNIAPAPAATATAAAPGPALPPPAARSAAAPVRPVATGNGTALPIPTALPVLRLPAAVAPAHPQAGGTAVGAPVTTPAATPVAPSAPLPPVRLPEAPAAIATPPVIVPNAPLVAAPQHPVVMQAPVSPPVLAQPPHAVAPGSAPAVAPQHPVVMQAPVSPPVLAQPPHAVAPGSAPAVAPQHPVVTQAPVSPPVLAQPPHAVAPGSAPAVAPPLASQLPPAPQPPVVHVAPGATVPSAHPTPPSPMPQQIAAPVPAPIPHPIAAAAAPAAADAHPVKPGEERPKDPTKP